MPQAHAAVVSMKFAELPYSGAQSVFLIVLLNKKYALPVRRFCCGEGVPGARGRLVGTTGVVAPVATGLRARYRGDLSDDLSGRILKLLKTHRHH